MPACEECGKPFTRIRSSKVFCAEPCRAAFNRRRRERGAELYDAFMSDETAAMQKLRDAYLTADKELRQGRRSWQSWRVAAMRIPMVFGREGDQR